MRIIEKIKLKLKYNIDDVIFAKRFIHLPFRKNILLIGTPEYNNVGDSILTVATLKFFSDYLYRCNIIEITNSEYYRYINVIKLLTTKKDVITFQPGGNMGNVWSREEDCRRNVIASFPNNKIIILPQTIYYENSEKGTDSLRESQKIYSAHKNLVIVAREKVSYELMEQYYPENSIMLVPDMALYLDVHNLNFKRKGILLCLRNDVEKLRTETDDKKIINYVSSFEYKYIDMYSEKEPNRNNRLSIVEEKIKEFEQAELVITDRLHGMICCAITETPCVVLSNNHHKVKGVYEWIKQLPYIEYIENIDDINDAIHRVESVEGRHYDNKKVFPYYDTLARQIQNNMRRKKLSYFNR